MGDIRRYSCDCGYTTELFFGAGMGAFNMRGVKALFPREAGYIEEMSVAGKKVSFCTYNEIAHCPRCKSIFSVSGLTYNCEGDGETKVFQSKCETCGGDIDIIQETELSCPKCGRKMEGSVVGHWD